MSQWNLYFKDQQYRTSLQDSFSQTTNKLIFGHNKRKQDFIKHASLSPIIIIKMPEIKGCKISQKPIMNEKNLAFIYFCMFQTFFKIFGLVIFETHGTIVFCLPPTLFGSHVTVIYCEQNTEFVHSGCSLYQMQKNSHSALETISGEK